MQNEEGRSPVCRFCALPNDYSMSTAEAGRIRRSRSSGRPVSNKKEDTMRFMVIVKASQESEAGVLPSEQMLAEMGRYNEELVKAGVMLGGEGLQSSSKGARVKFSGTNRTVIDGPFAETKELVAGFWLWE